MNWRIQRNEQLIGLMVVAGLALGCIAAPQASGAWAYPGGGPTDEGTSIEDPSVLKNPEPEEPDVWDEGDPDGIINPVGHIDIPEIDKDDKPKAPAPTPLLLPPLPGDETGDDLFGTIEVDPDIIWMRATSEFAPQIDPPAFNGQVIVSAPTLNGVPAPGGIGVLGLGMLAVNRRRR